jgi:2-polyprenyl-3-methyl-5-hydroxy-6-metoxy-1,4-benzoquinol methylase
MGNHKGMCLHDEVVQRFSKSEVKTMNNPNSPEKIRQLVQEVNNAGGLYHRICLDGGLVMDGEYDMTKYLHYYGIPENLTGKTVLDIGTSTGFFAFHCARRGANVTAIDVWDGVLLNSIRDALGLDVRYVQKSIYDLDAAFGQFDIVICGSLLLHLRDVFGAIERIRSVCKGEAIVATASIEDPRCDHMACCEFVGSKALGGAGEYWVYWHLNTSALKKMLIAADFAEAYEVSKFILKSEPGKSGFAVPHIVVKATV